MIDVCIRDGCSKSVSVWIALAIEELMCRYKKYELVTLDSTECHVEGNPW